MAQAQQEEAGEQRRPADREQPVRSVQLRVLARQGVLVNADRDQEQSEERRQEEADDEVAAEDPGDVAEADTGTLLGCVDGYPSTIVTGPSFTSSSSIRAPKTPRATGTPSASSSRQKAS